MRQRAAHARLTKGRRLNDGRLQRFAALPADAGPGAQRIGTEGDGPNFRRGDCPNFPASGAAPSTASMVGSSVSAKMGLSPLPFSVAGCLADSFASAKM